MENNNNTVAVWMNNTMRVLREGTSNNNEHLCHLCGFLYSSNFTLRRHITLKHEQDTITQCAICFYQTNRLDNLHRHYRTVHKFRAPYPDGLTMPKPAQKRDNKATQQNNDSPVAGTSQQQHNEVCDREVPDYAKCPDSTGAYVYYNTLRPSQKQYNWEPQLVDINASEVPSYTNLDTEYPRLQSTNSDPNNIPVIPVYSETLEADEMPVDPRSPTEEETEARPTVEIILESDFTPGVSSSITENNAVEQPTEDGEPEDTTMTLEEELAAAVNSITEEDASITEEDAAALEAFLMNNEPNHDEPTESFLDMLLRED